MPHSVTWIDRLRIGRVVWTLDQRLYDLPRKSRIAKRRDVRANLLTAAHDIGTADALRNLGNGQQLAAEYIAAEFGDGPRPFWVAAATFALTTQLLFTWMLSEAAMAFGDGVTAANPHATGTFAWSGIKYLQDTVTYTFVDGKHQSVERRVDAAGVGHLDPHATVLVGRLWRVTKFWHRRHPVTNPAAG